MADTKLEQAITNVAMGLRTASKGHPTCQTVLAILNDAKDYPMAAGAAALLEKAIDELRRKLDESFPAKSSNVADYFIERLGEYPYDSFSYEKLKEFPLDSEVGRQCKEALDSGRALLYHVENTAGSNFPARNEMVRRLVGHVVCTYAFG